MGPVLERFKESERAEGISRRKGFLTKRHIIADVRPSSLPSSKRQSLPPQSKTLAHWGNKLAVLGLLLIFAVGLFIGLRNYKNQGLELVSRERAEVHDKVYKIVLANNLDNLLKRLDGLTASYHFRTAFPEITSMAAIIAAKRGSSIIDKAEAAQESIWRVKKLFDLWRTRPLDFAEKERPTKSDINLFLLSWEKTKPLLSQLKEARENSIVYLNKKMEAINGIEE